MADKRTPAGQAFLNWLNEEFGRARTPVVPVFPWNPQTDEIRLPDKVNRALRQLVLSNNRIKAVQRVAHLTSARLRASKDNLDRLVQEQSADHTQ